MLFLQKIPLFSKPRLSELTLRGTNTSTSSTVTCPSGVQAGDFIVLFQRSSNAGSFPSNTTPSGFTSEIYIDNVVNVIIKMDVKIANGTEGGTSIIGMNGSSTNYKAIMVFYGNAPITGYSSLSEASALGNSNPSAQVCTSGSGSPPIVMVACYSGGSAVSPRTFTGATEDAEITPSTNFYAKYKIFNSSPVNVTVDMEDEGNDNGLLSAYFQFTS